MHQNLAARNVFMMDETHVKISDVGHSRTKIYENCHEISADLVSGLPIKIFWYNLVH